VLAPFRPGTPARAVTTGRQAGQQLGTGLPERRSALGQPPSRALRPPRRSRGPPTPTAAPSPALQARLSLAAITNRPIVQGRDEKQPPQRTTPSLIIGTRLVFAAKVRGQLSPADSAIAWTSPSIYVARTPVPTRTTPTTELSAEGTTCPHPAVARFGRSCRDDPGSQGSSGSRTMANRRTGSSGRAFPFDPRHDRELSRTWPQAAGSEASPPTDMSHAELSRIPDQHSSKILRAEGCSVAQNDVAVTARRPDPQWVDARPVSQQLEANVAAAVQADDVSIHRTAPAPGGGRPRRSAGRCAAGGWWCRCR
jgi:hypothetical protein